MIYPEKRTVLTQFNWNPFGGLEPRKGYRAIQEFVDYDGDMISVGWKGCYRAFNYLPYDDELSLAFDDSEGLCIIRLHLRPGDQEAVGNNLMQYFRLDEESLTA